MKQQLAKALLKVGKFAKNEIEVAVNEAKVKRLIQKTRSSNRTERLLAKSDLLRLYPHIYEAMLEEEQF